MKVTIKEIAEIAGVHRATVDKVLHDRPGVSDEVRQKIKKIIDDLEYTPNHAGRVLQKQSKIYHFAAILCDVDAAPFLQAGIQEGVRNQANFNIEVSFHYTSFQNAVEQSHFIDQAVRDGVDGIILSPIHSQAVREAINRTVMQGVPVVTIDSDILDSARLCYVGLDGVRASRVAGRLMGQLTGGEGEIAIISSAIATENNNYFVAMREQGFRRFIEENYPGIRIVECIESFEDPRITYEKTKELIDRYPALRGIYITCGGITEVGRALLECGRSDAIRVICFEDYPQTLELLRIGVIDITLAGELTRQGALPVELLIKKLVFEEDPPQNQIFTEIRILVKESID